jgi:hypothetical protein
MLDYTHCSSIGVVVMFRSPDVVNRFQTQSGSGGSHGASRLLVIRVVVAGYA